MYDGFDWNGNGERDMGDAYMDYQIMNEEYGGGGPGGSGGSGGSGSGCGCVVMVIMVLGLLYLLGSCS